MKKIVTFANFMVLIGIMTILFYLIPAVSIKAISNPTEVNLFVATFGGSFTVHEFVDVTRSLSPCGGLITAFVLGVVAILLTLTKAKNKYATLLACPFYIASGVLVACTASLVKSVNANAGVDNIFTYNIAGGAITVATFWCILGFFALIDFISVVAKPKQQSTAY
ncbi:MAG: hypothetical protein MJ213_00215 [Bacilli bacterium]|nr:hypothetical protein [Bacilli bacterium]